MLRYVPMNRRCRILVSVAALAAFAGIAWTYSWLKLTHYRHQIEARYSAEIAGIESGSRDYPSWQAISNDDFDAAQAAREKRDAISDKIAKSLDKAEVVVSGWSNDGHHGSLGLIWRTSGYSRYPFCWSSDWDGQHTVRYGKTFDGQPLSVFTGWVADGQKREYEIGFLASSVKAW